LLPFPRFNFGLRRRGLRQAVEDLLKYDDREREREMEGGRKVLVKVKPLDYEISSLGRA